MSLRANEKPRKERNMDRTNYNDMKKLTTEQLHRELGSLRSEMPMPHGARIARRFKAREYRTVRRVIRERIELGWPVRS